MAAVITTTITAQRGTCPKLAATPPRIAAVSPGTTKPTKRASSTKTMSPTSPSTLQVGALRMWSTIALTTASQGARRILGAGRAGDAATRSGRSGDDGGRPWEVPVGSGTGQDPRGWTGSGPRLQPMTGALRHQEVRPTRSYYRQCSRRGKPQAVLT